MPSAKILEAKKAYVAELNTKIAGSLAGVVVAYNGISVADDTKMRKELREAGVEYMVVKNTMLRRAVAGTQYEALAEYFKGDTAIALSAEDPAAAARILCKVADADKSKRFTVKGGFCDGQVLDAAGVKGLSTMPNREGLLSMLAGSLNGIIGGLAVAIQGIVDKQEETPAA
ncbi:MAG: 50S ribosomal protein L10 [Subdoligranulum sp.]|jgi:ribosomal protein L10|uniref:50S ribosomal protein L10 n=1 Tax=Gemmiger qucibialis TaxID=2997294 RepID=UPI003A4A7C91